MKLIPEYNRDLLHRYDKILPRYTSYPTALQFKENFPVETWLHKLQNRSESSEPFSLYFHIPFCRSQCFYCACSTVITANKSRGALYLDALIKEVEFVANHIPQSQRVVSQIHLGGGTPTFLSKEELSNLWEAIQKHFKLSHDGEYAIEIDPRTCDVETIKHLIKLGFNRISFGIQDLDPDVQKAVNRVQKCSDIIEQINVARSCGINSINFDLIYGLPLQTNTKFSKTLDKIIEMKPDRTAIYAYAHMPHIFRGQMQINKYSLPNLSEKLGLFELAINKLHAAGYEYIGLDHFALPNNELALARRNGTLQRNFQGYSTQKQSDMLGFGMTSIGKFDDIYYQNTKNEKDYIQLVMNGKSPIAKGYQMSHDDHIRKKVIMELMCTGLLNFDEFFQETQLSFSKYFVSEIVKLNELAKDNLIKINDDSLEILPVGQLLLRNICNIFDAYA